MVCDICVPKLVSKIWWLLVCALGNLTPISKNPPTISLRFIYFVKNDAVWIPEIDYLCSISFFSLMIFTGSLILLLCFKNPFLWG